MNPSLPHELPSDDPVPPYVQGYVSVRGGRSVFDGAARGRVATSAEPFRAKKQDREGVRRDLERTGFRIVAESSLGFAVAAAPGAYEEITGGRVRTTERLLHAEAGCVRYVTHVDIVGEKQPAVLGVAKARSAALRVDGILVERPRILLGVFPSPVPPTVSCFHLRVPDDVAVGLGAHAAHRAGRVGAGVLVAMPDSGQYRHPYFAAHGYKVNTALTTVPGTDPSRDPIGHGTGESANVFAIAPGATLQPIRCTDADGNFVAAFSGFLAAKALSPQVLTNSWGGDGPFPPPPGGPDAYDQALALEILDAIQSGIFVVFSGGNGQFSIEPQVPGVFAAGGVHMGPSLDLKASDYTSGYRSPWYANVVVPDACGLVGMRPRAQYLMLPIQPGCMIDVDESAPDLPDDPTTDGTGASDGWALFSGTSAAAPQVAGVAALILGAKPGLTPAQVNEAIKATAIDVTAGRCHPRFDQPAVSGRDLATGFGLVDASAAVQYAIAKF